MPSPVTRPHRSIRLPAVLGGCLLAALPLAGCSMFTPASHHEALGSPSAATSAKPTPSPTQSPKPKHCAKIAPGFSCVMRNRIHAVQRYLRHAPGSIGIVLHDRPTGATWGNGNATTLYPAASTIKLAMMTDILQRQAAGQFTLSPADQRAMFGALFTSNDHDADDLWYRYENASFMDRVRAFGMNSTQFTNQAYWGDVDTTAEDLDNLMNYVLGQATPSIRNYLVHRLQHVSSIDQQWGVWGAGPENQPGNKDGWEQDPGPTVGTWITNTVGFAGPNHEYTLAITYDLGSFDDVGDVGFNYGINTLTQIASILFQGHQTQQPTAQASAVP